MDTGQRRTTAGRGHGRTSRPSYGVTGAQKKPAAAKKPGGGVAGGKKASSTASTAAIAKATMDNLEASERKGGSKVQGKQARKTESRKSQAPETIKKSISDTEEERTGSTRRIPSDKVEERPRDAPKISSGRLDENPKAALNPFADPALVNERLRPNNVLLPSSDVAGDIEEDEDGSGVEDEASLRPTVEFYCVGQLRRIADLTKVHCNAYGVQVMGLNDQENLIRYLRTEFRLENRVTGRKVLACELYRFCRIAQVPPHRGLCMDRVLEELAKTRAGIEHLWAFKPPGVPCRPEGAKKGPHTIWAFVWHNPIHPFDHEASLGARRRTLGPITLTPPTTPRKTLQPSLPQRTTRTTQQNAQRRKISMAASAQKTSGLDMWK